MLKEDVAMGVLYIHLGYPRRVGDCYCSYGCNLLSFYGSIPCLSLPSSTYNLQPSLPPLVHTYDPSFVKSYINIVEYVHCSLCGSDSSLLKR